MPDFLKTTRIASRPKSLAFLSAAIAIGLLIVGLWPFDFRPQNGVSKLPSGGLRFDGTGIGVVVPDHGPERLYAFAEIVKIEMLVRPKAFPVKRLNHIISFRTSQNRESFVLAQRQQHLVARWRPQGEARWHETVAQNALIPDQRHRITVIADGRGVALFADGRGAGALTGRTPAGELGQFLVGSGIDKFSGWDGELIALAISRSPAEADGVSFRPGPQVADLPEEPDPVEPMLALGRLPGDRFLQERDSASRCRLELPPRYVVFRRPFLAPWWADFRTSRDFLADVVLNLLGFMPLGLCAGLALNGSRLPSGLRFLFVLGAGFTVSLGIEAVQVWLPDRTSQLADLLLNTAGTGIGAAVSVLITRPRFSGS